jgi:arabinan endo-1,5-alpha-L-arabinosidase
VKILNKKYTGFLLLNCLLAAFIFSLLNCNLQAQSVSSPIVHDPVMIKQDSTYYLFCTGWGITTMSSVNLKDWKIEKPVFNKPPEWTKLAVTDFKGHIWAPDISYHDGEYYLYYSVSSFEKNTSCIGLVTNKTLDTNSKDFEWKDRGMIVQSVPGRDMWNAIDPNLAYDENGTPWLSFGSFWNGIKLVRLNPNQTSISKNPEEWFTISSRPRTFEINDKKPGDGAVEAPFIFKKGKFYYLFVSFDFCCRGVKSNYKIMVGRSEKITGPYIDKQGKKLEEGGGSLVLEGNEKFPGLGHNAVYTFDKKDYLIFHAYDASDDGKPKLKIIEMKWDKDGWPENLAEQLNAQ